MTDLKLTGIPELIAGLIRDAPVDEKAQLVLGFEWPSVTGPDADPAMEWVAARLDLVLLTWDPFAAYDDETMDRSFSITPVGDDCRLHVLLALGRLGLDPSVSVLQEISGIAESYIRACADRQPRLADAAYLAAPHADVLLDILLAARQKTATLPPPDLRVVSDGWRPIDHQLLMNMSAAQFGPITITLEPIPPAVFDPITIGCPACEDASYADVFELGFAMDLCSQHRAWRNAQYARVLGDAEADDPEGVELLLDVITRSHLPHVPYPLYTRVMGALMGDVSLEDAAAAVIDLCEWAGSPDRFEAGAADLGFEPDSLDFSDFLTHVPFRLGLDGQFERAEEVLDARAMAQGDGAVHYGGLALELARVGKFDEADRLMDRALSSLPPPWLVGLAEMEAAQIAELRNDRESAEASYEDAIRVARLGNNDALEADAQRMLADLIEQEPGREPDAARARRRADEIMKRVAAQMPASSVQAPVRVEAKVGRNDPCPCGSGRKFKHCHGA